MLILFFLISCVLALAYIWLIHFYVKGWLKTPNQNTLKDYLPSHGVSVVVSIRNEELYILDCINSILAQNYPKELYEIIVVNDFSTDKTLEILQSFGNQIRLFRLRDYLPPENANVPNKKKAITLAVENAKHEIILCGDGDCVYGSNWIQSMVQYHRKYQKSFVAGPVDYLNINNFWKQFLMMDLVAMIGVTAGSIGQKRPVMASGANMLFTKTSFNSVNGYVGNEKIPSGDDVFLMQKIFKQNNKAVGFVKNTDAFAKTHPATSFKDFINQRIRWTSKSSNLIDRSVQNILVLNYLFYLVCFLSLFILPFFNHFILGIGIVLLLLKILIDALFFGNMLAFYNKNYLMKWILPMEFLHISYVSFMGIMALFGTYSWKGRTVKK